MTTRLSIEPRKILVVKPSSLGDIVHSLPFLNAIKSRFPKAEIHWMVAKGFEGLIEEHPMIDRLWVINKDAWKRIGNVKGTLVELRALFRDLRNEKYDLVADLQGLLRSGIITAATRSRIRIGFKEAREGSRLFYTHKVAGGRAVHAVDRYLKIADFLGCDTSEISFPLPDFNFSACIPHPSSLPSQSFSKTLDIQHSTFNIQEGYAVIVPGARWKTKRWQPEKFAELASLLPLASVVVGSKSDMETAAEIVSLSQGKAMSLAGKTDLKELVEIMRRARFVVTNDSGPMHIAAALGIQVFAIFGPTDPVRTGPYGKGHTIIRADVYCAPCFKKKCDDMQCIRNLSVDKVFEIIKSKQLM